MRYFLWCQSNRQDDSTPNTTLLDNFIAFGQCHPVDIVLRNAMFAVYPPASPAVDIGNRMLLCRFWHCINDERAKGQVLIHHREEWQHPAQKAALMNRSQ